jgi:hypothetical protein
VPRAVTIDLSLELGKELGQVLIGIHVLPGDWVRN